MKALKIIILSLLFPFVIVGLICGLIYHGIMSGATWADKIFTDLVLS